MSYEVIQVVLFGLVIVLIPLYFVWGMIDFKKELRKRNRAREDFLESLQPGVLFVLRKEPEINPFKISEPEIVKILETRKNIDGEIWVLYQNMKTEKTRSCHSNNFMLLYEKM